MNTRKNIVSKAVSVLLCLAICIGCFSAMLTVSATPASLTTNGNGGATDVGAWFTTYNTSAFWGSNGRFSNPELAQVGFKALKSDGTYGIPNSGSVSEIDFQIRKMAEAGIDFILFDLTNGGLSSEIDYGNDASLAFIVNNAKLTCERLSAWNDTHTWKIKYAVAVGIYDKLRKQYTGSQSGSPYTHTTADLSTAATIGFAAELQAQAVYEQFVSNATYGDDYYEIDGNPLLVLHDTSGRSGSAKVTEYSNKGGTTTYVSNFTVRDSVSQAGAGDYGWYTNGSTSDNNDCGTVADDEVMVVCPGHWNHDSNTPKASRENGAHYEANWDAVLANTPRIVMIAALNDYMEDEAIWPTDTTHCTVEETWSNPYQYWNMTVNYINQLRTANGDTVPSAAERSGNVAFGATVTANHEVEVSSVSPVSCLTDGIIDYDRDTKTTAVTNYESSGIGYFEVTLGSAADINQVKVIRTTWEAASFPKDIAIDVQNASGSWKRVAEKHEIPSNVPHALVFNFATVTNATKIRVSANKARNNSGNFRVAEIETYYDSTITSADYTGVAKDGTYDIPEISNGNLLLGKIASYTPGRAIEANKPLSNLTDGKYLYHINKANCTYTSVTYGQYNSDTLEAHSAYFEYSFDDAVRLNSLKFYPCNAEEAKPRPRDIAIDVQLEDGTWQRVAADYNIIYDFPNVGGTYYEDSPFSLMYLQYKFAPVDCVKIRITSNRKRMRINKGLTGSTCVFRLAEIEAFYDPSITTYSGVERPDQADYAVPTPGLVNYAAGATATAKGNSAGISNLTDGDKTNRAFAYYYQETSTPTDAQCINYVDIDFGAVKTIDRVDLIYSRFADDDRGHREKDVAIDIITEDGRFVRVAEKHNFTEAAAASDGSNYTLKMTFDPTEAKGIRISGNCKQTTRYTAGNFDNVFQCYAEVEVYNDPNVVSNTGVEEATVEGTAIPAYNSANMAFGGTVTSSNTNASLATSYPATRLTDGNTKVAADCAIINYVSHFAYYEIDLGSQKTMNQIKLYLSQYEKEKLPVDLAAYAYVSGAWKRVAERHNVDYTGVTSLTFNFAAVTTDKIRVRVTNNTNSTSDNFRLVEIGAFYRPDLTSESYNAVVYSDVNEDFETNASDLTTLINVLLGTDVSHEIDVNQDTYSDVRDLVSLKKILSNLASQG